MDSYDNDWIFFDDDLFCLWEFCEEYKKDAIKQSEKPALPRYEPLRPEKTIFKSEKSRAKWLG